MEFRLQALLNPPATPRGKDELLRCDHRRSEDARYT